MGIDYTSIYGSLYTIGATDSGVLALVNSVFTDKELNKLADKQLPYLVWKYESTTGARGEMSELHASWWIYVAPAENERALYAIVEALDTAYLNQLSISGGRTKLGKPSAPFTDKSLNGLQGISVGVSYRTLG